METVDKNNCSENANAEHNSGFSLGENIKPTIEAILFSTDEPLSVKKIADILGESNSDKDTIQSTICQLKEEYETCGKGFQIEEIAGGYQILSQPEYHEFVSKLLKKKKEAKISHSSLETLAIIAYKQPILRADIEAIRGVQSGQMIRILIDMGLVKVTGHADVLGRPLLYGTTNKFLQHFGLNSIKELPNPGEKVDDKE